MMAIVVQIMSLFLVATMLFILYRQLGEMKPQEIKKQQHTPSREFHHNRQREFHPRQVPPPPPIYTSGKPKPYTRVGVLHRNGTEGPSVLPLFGRPSTRNSNRWNYYTTTNTDGANPFRLQIYDETGMDCSRSDERGCVEAQDGTNFNVRPYGDFTVDVYRD